MRDAQQGLQRRQDLATPYIARQCNCHHRPAQERSMPALRHIVVSCQDDQTLDEPAVDEWCLRGGCHPRKDRDPALQQTPKSRRKYRWRISCTPPILCADLVSEGVSVRLFESRVMFGGIVYSHSDHRTPFPLGLRKLQGYRPMQAAYRTQATLDRRCTARVRSRFLVPPTTPVVYVQSALLRPVPRFIRYFLTCSVMEKNSDCMNLI